MLFEHGAYALGRTVFRSGLVPTLRAAALLLYREPNLCAPQRNGYTAADGKKLFRDVAGPCLAPNGSVVCIGAFDGVHLGHQAVLNHVRGQALSLGPTPRSGKFRSPIPRAFFACAWHGSAAVNARRARKSRLWCRWACSGCCCCGSQRRWLRCPPRILWPGSWSRDWPRVRCGLVKTSRFGHGRAGDLQLLQGGLGKSAGFHAQAVARIDVDGDRVSSSGVSGARLAAGDFRRGGASSWGGASPSPAMLVRGQQLGRKLGYPTANLRLGARTAPIGGIFAVRVSGVGAQPRPGVASLGVRPTVNGKEPLLEAHLFDFDGDLYGKRIEVEFVEKLREEEKFTDLSAMVQQIDRDAALARRILGVAARATTGAVT